tara:strand:- start:535 stop:900 length:366 start_codon:yes stop_codon:yes gene_type:complete
MTKIEEIVERKKKIQKCYEDELLDYVMFQRIEDDVKASHWMVSFLLEDENKRDSLMKHLGDEGIETRPFFKQISDMPFYKKAYNKNSLQLSKTGINVPSYPELSDRDVKFICTKIKNFLSN